MTKIAASQYQELAAMHKAGRTQVDLAKTFGVGISRMGQIIRTQAQVDASRAAKALNKWGMTLSEYDEHVEAHGSCSMPGSPMRKYVEQRKGANARGIKWNFDFASWWIVWQESGRWADRNRGNGYVMARNNDGDTPYGPTTVYICTGAQNVKDGYANSRAVGYKRGPEVGSGKGVYPSNSVRNPYRVLFRQKHLGCYPTETSARAAYLAAAEAHRIAQ